MTLQSNRPRGNSLTKHAQGWGSSSPESGGWGGRVRVGGGVRCQNEVPMASPAQLLRLGDAYPGFSWWHSIKGLCELQSVCVCVKVHSVCSLTCAPLGSACLLGMLQEAGLQEAGLAFPPGRSRSPPPLSHTAQPHPGCPCS